MLYWSSCFFIRSDRNVTENLVLGAVDARNGGIVYFPTNNRLGRKNKSAIEFGAQEKFVFDNAPEFDSVDFEDKCKSQWIHRTPNDSHEQIQAEIYMTFIIWFIFFVGEGMWLKIFV